MQFIVDMRGNMIYDIVRLLNGQRYRTLAKYNLLMGRKSVPLPASVRSELHMFCIIFDIILESIYSLDVCDSY